MPFTLRAGVATFAAAVALSAPAAEPPQAVPVFREGDGGYASYRIPSLLPTPKGTLLAFCEGRKGGRGDAGDIDLVLRRSTDGGRTWAAMQTVWDDGPNTCGNPCPVVAADGRVVLLLTRNNGDDTEAEIKARTGRGSRTVWVCESADDGVTWSAPREITKDVKRDDWTWYATGPGVGIRLERGPHAGRLVVPCDYGYPDENGTRQDVKSEYGSHVIYSDDGGRTWTLGGTVAPKMNECQVAELAEPPGGLLLDMRSYRGRACRAEATSADGGATWTEPQDVPALPEPVCQASLVRIAFPDGETPGLLAFSNPADAKRRANLTVRGSRDDGRTWPAAVVLHPGPAAYSCLAPLPTGDLACLYERGAKSPYEEIAFQVVPRASLAP